ncbi:telomere repeat-binding factor 2 isoform X3 [Neltuma alba]|uniref:telomere repeat-binding factor 2 isoform X3 n=1 Tax=Neltuma alba TaxID=207710 RepID=UPI0010A383B7|nr:telomere repeat-binding factor 2 isoform X3 [Prosopis alba]
MVYFDLSMEKMHEKRLLYKLCREKRRGKMESKKNSCSFHGWSLPPTGLCGTLHIRRCATFYICSWLDNLILEAIINLKEPKGTDRAAIAAYIEEHYCSPPNLRKLLSMKLKHMVASGKLTKVKHKYRITQNSAISEKRRHSNLLLLEGRPKDSPKAEKTNVNILSKSQIDAELSKMKGVTAQEAAAAAAKAVAEAEAAIAEAEAAAREAEAAEAEAEAAQVFAKAAMKALKCRALQI